MAAATMKTRSGRRSVRPWRCAECSTPHRGGRLISARLQLVWRNGVADPTLARFDGQKYISLETFKKSGQGVRTPVWFVLHNSAFYAYTEADSGKVKRIRNNPRV